MSIAISRTLSWFLNTTERNLGSLATCWLLVRGRKCIRWAWNIYCSIKHRSAGRLKETQHKHVEITGRASTSLLLLLLLLSCFSRVRLCVTPQKATHQAPPSLGFSRQEHWSGLPFPSPVHKVKSQWEVAQSCLTLSDLMDCSLPGSSVHGIFQARVLKWGAIAFSER